MFLVDGFNLYHSLRDNPLFCAYRWLNIDALARAFIAPSKECIICTTFFTAVPTWDAEKRKRHQGILRVYKDLGVAIREGTFTESERNCERTCGEVYPTHEEKNTDINICLEMMRMGRDDLADRIYLVTADSDQAASIREFRELYPEKQVYVVFPPGRYSSELQQVSHANLQISASHLESAQLPDPHTCKNGTVIAKPHRWCQKPTRFPIRRGAPRKFSTDGA